MEQLPPGITEPAAGSTAAATSSTPAAGGGPGPAVAPGTHFHSAPSNLQPEPQQMQMQQQQVQQQQHMQWMQQQQQHMQQMQYAIDSGAMGGGGQAAPVGDGGGGGGGGGLKRPLPTDGSDLFEEEDGEEDDDGPAKTAVKAAPAKRKKIEIKYIEEKPKRHITYSKRRGGVFKKAYELAELTHAEVLLVVASETGNIHTYATPKFKHITQDDNDYCHHCTRAGWRDTIEACLKTSNDETAHQYPDGNAPDPQGGGGGGGGAAAAVGSGAVGGVYEMPNPQVLAMDATAQRLMAQAGGIDFTAGSANFQHQTMQQQQQMQMLYQQQMQMQYAQSQIYQLSQVSQQAQPMPNYARTPTTLGGGGVGSGTPADNTALASSAVDRPAAVAIVDAEAALPPESEQQQIQKAIVAAAAAAAATVVQASPPT